jgi:hypothetical protein
MKSLYSIGVLSFLTHMLRGSFVPLGIRAGHMTERKTLRKSLIIVGSRISLESLCCILSLAGWALQYALAVIIPQSVA